MKDYCVWKVLAVAVLFVACESTNPIQNGNASGLLDNLMANYDKRFRPNYGGAPVDVEVSMYIISVSAVSDDNLDFTMDFYFRTFWNDPRLAFEKKPGLDKLSLGHEFSKSIWVPDLFFLQDKRESFQHAITAKNEFIKVTHSGNVTRSVRLSLTAACPMNFRNFPMDSQSCRLDIESYGHSAHGIKLHWKEPVQLSNQQLLLTHKITGHNETSEDIVLASAIYSRLLFELSFQRISGFYCRQVYIPCTMLVLISWISFWLKRGSAERLTISVLSLTILVLGCQLLGYDLPKTSYSKAIDVFTGVCLTFTFYALVEFLYVSKKTSQDKIGTSSIDKVSIVAFPIAFALFNVVYWCAF